MAHAEKLVKSWRVKYQLADGSWAPWISGFPTKSAALAKGRELEAASKAGTYVDPKLAMTPFGKWVPIWTAAQRVDPGTVAKRRRLLKTHLLPEWENTPLCKINLFVAKAWGARQTCDQVTVGHALTLLSMILTGAADAEYITHNPLAGRRRKTGGSNIDEEEKAEKVWAQPDQAYDLYERLGGVAGLMVLTTAYTGLRWGELTGLHKSNCLLLRQDRVAGKVYPRKVIRIDRKVGALHEVEIEVTPEQLAEWRAREDARIEAGIAKGRSPRRRKDPETRIALYLGKPKNKKSAREVDVPPFLAELLAVHMATWKHPYLFTTPTDGAWWRRSNFGRALRPAADGRAESLRRVGTAGHPGWEPIVPGLTMHGLRHGHDTWMKEDHVDRALRFERMGWLAKDIEGVYEHVTPQMRQDLLTALQARWEGALEHARQAS